MGINEEIKEVDEKTKKIEKKVEKIEEQSFAMEMIKFSNSQLKSANKRQFIIILILLFAFIGVCCYCFYLLNDIRTIEETTTQEISDFDTINGNVINKGDSYGQDKTNNKK